MRTRPSNACVLLAIMLAAAVCIIPVSVANSHVGIDSQAYADSTRSAFVGVNDAISQEGDAATQPVAKADYTSHVTAMMQNSVMSGGCEVVSLGIALQSMGLPADLNQIVDDHLEVDGHFATGYSGNPYSKGAGYPPGIADAANKYLEALDVQARAHNLTGSSFEDVAKLVERGYPVLVWTTMDFERPQFSGAFDNGVEWYDNEHCVVYYGTEGDKALISDPLEGLVKRDLSKFAELYAQCGNMALAIY